MTTTATTIFQKNNKTIILSVSILLVTILSVSFNAFSQKSTGNLEDKLWQNEPFGNRNLSSEMVGKRDAFSKHFINEDGTMTAHIASGYINYFEDNQWKTIFHTILPSADGFENVTNSHKTYYPATSTGAITTVLPNGAILKDMIGMRMYYSVNENAVQVQNIKSKQGNAEFNKLTYFDVYGSGIDLVLTQNTTKRKMDYVIQNRSALGEVPVGADFLVFEERVQLPNGWKGELEKNYILLKDASGKLQTVYEQPDFYDQMVNPLESENENYFPKMIGEYELIHEGNELVILTKVPLNWLLDANRNFPVVIDPSANFTPSNTSNWTGTLDTYLSGGAGTPAKANLFASTNISQWVPHFYSDDYIRQGTYRQSAVVAGLPPVGNYLMNGWAKFNTSSISHCTVINSIVLNAYVFSVSNNAIQVHTNLRAMANDPVAATEANRLIDIRDGSIYKNVIDPYPNGWRGGNLPPTPPTVPQQGIIVATRWRNFTLAAPAMADLLANLPTGAFSVGFHAYNANTGTGTTSVAVAYLEASGHTDANKVYLVVDYGTCLPVNLNNFNANCIDNSVNVNWSTASEHNSQKFIVEKSQDGEHWRAFDELAAAGNSTSELHYSVIDNSASYGTSYYRLRQIDLDGKENIIGPISVNCSSTQTMMSVYPNPAENSFTVVLNANHKMNDVNLCILDLNGRVINKKAVKLIPGTNTVHFDDLTLTNGSYFVNVESDEDHQFTPVKLVIHN